MLRALLLVCLTSPINADPVFRDLSSNLEAHEYTGEWEHYVGGGLAVLDCNGDDRPDLFAAGGASPPALFVNKGKMSFDRAELPLLTSTIGAYPLDLDADGLMDLFVLRVGQNQILKGDGNCGFTKANDLFGIPDDDKWSTAFTAWWEGEDRPVLAIGNYVDRTNPEGPFFACDTNTILRPDAAGYASTDLVPGYCPLSMLAALDARGRRSLRLSNDRQYYVRGGYEQLWDTDDQRFLTEEDGWRKVSIWGMGIASRDLNGDGRDEVMLTSMGDQLLQLAQPDGSYTNAPYGLGTTAHIPFDGSDGRPSTGWHAQFGDVDNDTRPDIFISKGNVDQMPSNAIHDPNNLLIQQADGRFVEMAGIAGIATTERSRGAALVDLDADGRLDLVVVNRRAPMELYRNETEKMGHWLAIKLQQGSGNRNAIGAIVNVSVNGQSQSQQMVIGGGHAGGQAVPLHFGLGDAVEALVNITWPDQTETTLTAKADQTLVINRN
ncbi:CRTAC1 family protein [Litoreibacter janthinus]|uniref:CRTAC1 family protein n=1 Tax=Litoreibacter janthinus TaxID=670154 RepID=UPI000B800952|nr:CRTAC1 family protein [Litoreibacter janthinus]